jgi:hypothetical protein
MGDPTICLFASGNDQKERRKLMIQEIKGVKAKTKSFRWGKR